jgi:hypothetical protein
VPAVVLDRGGHCSIPATGGRSAKAAAPYVLRDHNPNRPLAPMVTPGSVGDWMQALTMVAALAGLAAACGRALGEEDRHALSRRPGPSRPPSGLVEDAPAVEDVEAVR